MKQNKVPKNEYIRKPVGKTNPYKHDVDYVSRMGYRDDSPFNDRPYIDIHTPSGMIDMSNTGIPLMANGMYLPPYSGMHQFEPGIVREQKIPMAQNGRIKTPEGWEKEIRAVENKIGDPKKWSQENYQELQDKLNEYKAWRENTAEGKAVVDYHNEPNEYVVPLPEQLKDPNMNYEKDLISKVLMNRNRDKDFVKRAYDVGAYPNSNMFTGLDTEDFGNRMSHKMSWGEDESGQAYMYPNIYNSNNEAIKIPNQYADYISSEGYKKATGIPVEKNGGGLLNKTLTCPSCGWSWKAVDGGTDITTCHKCGGTAKLAYGGDPSLPNIEGHYPFGGQNSKTGTHFEEGGWLDKYAPGGTPGNPPVKYVDPNTPSGRYALDMYGDSALLADRSSQANAILNSFLKNNKYVASPNSPEYQKMDRLMLGDSKLLDRVNGPSNKFPLSTNPVSIYDPQLKANVNRDVYSFPNPKVKVLPFSEKPKEKTKPVQKKKTEVITPDYLPMIQTGMPEMLSQEPDITPQFIFPKQSNIHNRISWTMDPDTRKMVPVYLEGKTQKVKEGKRLYNKNIPSSTAAIPADFVPQFEPDGNKDVVSKKMGGWLDKYQGDISGSQVMPSETTQSFIPANLKNKLDQLKKQDPKYKQKLAQEKKFYDDVAKAEEDARKKEIADRKARIANSIKAQDEKIIGNPNWREVLARQTQATGDKLRISDEPNFFDDYVNPAAMIGSMATGLGQAPYQAQQQDSYMPYLTGIGMPLAMGALAGLGAKSTGQFINNIVNPLAGLEQSLLNRGKGIISKKPGFLTTQEELAMMNADDFPRGVSTPAQGNQLPPPPSEIIISPSGESRPVWQQIPISDDPPMTSLANINQKDLNLRDDYANMMAGRPAQNYPHMDLAQNRLRQNVLYEERNRLLNEITTGDPDLSSFVSRTVLEAAPEVKTKIKNISGLTQEDVLARAASKDKDKIAKMSETEFENTVLNPNGEIITYKKGPEVNNITYDMNTGRMVLRDQNIIPEEEYINMFNTNLDRLNEIIAKKNKSGVQYRVKGLNREGHLTFETPEQLIPRQRTKAAVDNYNAFQEHPEIWAEERAGLRQNENGSWQFNEEIGMDAYSTKEGAVKALSEAVEDQLGPMKKISGESVWGVNMNPGKWQGDVQDIANKEYYRAIPGLEMSNTTASVFGDRTARRGSKAYEAINDYLKEMGMGRVKPGFNSQTQFSKGAWEDFVKKGKAFGYYGDPETVYGSMKSMLPYLGLGYLGYEGMQDDGYRRGGSLYTPPNLKKKSKSKGTSKNIQSSINSLFARNFDLYGSSNKAIYNPNSKYKEGGWLDEYQTRGEVLPQSVLAKPAITKEEDSKYDIYKQVIPKPQLTLEKKREFTPEEQAYSDKVKARIANPAADIGILAGNMASALSRGQYLTPEEIASVTNNPMKALGLSSEMATFALANEMVGPLLQKAITSIPRGAAVLGQLSKKSKYGTPRVVNDAPAIDYTFAQPPVEPVFTETIIDPLPQNTIVSNNIKPGQNKALDKIEAITDWNKWEKKYKGKNIAKKGHFNRGVFEIKGHPEFLAKIEEPGAFDSDMELVGKDYVNLDFPTLHSEITSPNIGKVIKQLPHPSNPNQRILVMKRVEGKGIRDLTANQLKKIPDEAFIQLDADLRDLRNKGLATDFVGDNILYNNKDKSFKIIDLSPTKTTMGPSMQDFWLENVIKGVDQSLPKEESAKKIREAVKNYFRETYRTGIDNVIQPPYYIRKKLTSEDPHISDRGNKLLEEYQQRTSPERIKNYRIKALNELRNKYSKVFNMLDEQPVQRFGGGWLDNLD